MTPEDKKNIRAEIEKRIKENEGIIEALREQTAPVPPSVAIGRLTRMDAIQQKQMAETNLKSTERLISNLKLALEKIDEPDFGVCAICKNDIPLGRLLAVPEAKACVQCISKGSRGRR